jgi:hypothetical protein
MCPVSFDPMTSSSTLPLWTEEVLFEIELVDWIEWRIQISGVDFLVMIWEIYFIVSYFLAIYTKHWLMLV